MAIQVYQVLFITRDHRTHTHFPPFIVYISFHVQYFFDNVFVYNPSPFRAHLSLSLSLSLCLSLSLSLSVSLSLSISLSRCVCESIKYHIVTWCIYTYTHTYAYSIKTHTQTIIRSVSVCSTHTSAFRCLFACIEREQVRE